MGMFKHRRILAATSAVAAAAGIMLLPATAMASPMHSANVALGTTAAAQGSWVVCSQVDGELYAAVAYVDPQGGFDSAGWYRLGARGACQTVLVRSRTSNPHNVFLRVEDKDGNARVGGDSWMCAARWPFRIIGNQDCTGRGYEYQGFHHKVIDLDKTWTTTLSPDPPICCA